MGKQAKKVIPWTADPKSLKINYRTQVTITGEFIEEWNKITPQNHIRNFEEQMAWERVVLGVISDIHRVRTNQRTLWMLEIIPTKTPVLKLFVLQIFRCEFW